MRAKRILAVAIGLILLLVVALVVIFGFVFPPAKIAAEVVRRAEAATGFDLGVESAGLGLGRGGLTVKLAKITVQEPTRPEPAILALDLRCRIDFIRRAGGPAAVGVDPQIAHDAEHPAV